MTRQFVNPERSRPSRQLIRQQLDAGKLGEVGLIRLHRWGPDSLLCDLDLVLWYFGKPPNLVYAVEQAGVRQIHLGFPGGGMALVGHAPLANAYCYLSVIGSTGAAYADDHQNAQLLFRGGSVEAVYTHEGAVRNAESDGAFPAWPEVVRMDQIVRESERIKKAVIV